MFWSKFYTAIPPPNIPDNDTTDKAHLYDQTPYVQTISGSHSFCPANQLTEQIHPSVVFDNPRNCLHQNVQFHTHNSWILASPSRKWCCRIFWRDASTLLISQYIIKDVCDKITRKSIVVNITTDFLECVVGKVYTIYHITTPLSSNVTIAKTLCCFKLLLCSRAFAKDIVICFNFHWDGVPSMSNWRRMPANLVP